MALPLWVSILLVIVVLILVYTWYMSRRHGELKKLGYDGPKPRWIIGNFTREGLIYGEERLYKEYKDKKVYGVYDANKPRLVVTDLDLIKDIMVKYFHCFTNRRQLPPLGGPMDYIMTRLNDDQWKHVRSTVSPTFSTGKIKLMSKHVESTCKLLVENLMDKMKKNEAFELKEVISCFTIDVIARAGFGVELNSTKDPENTFRSASKSIIGGFGKFIPLLLLFPFLISVFSRLKIPVIDHESVNIITTLVDQAMSSRREEEVKRKRNDFVQLLLNAEDEDIAEHDGSTKEEQEALKTDSHRKGMSKLEIQGQALGFILAGFDTTATVLSFTLFMMAIHPEVTTKAQEEIDQKLDGRFPNYDNAQSLNYLEMCINEGLRMYPPGLILERYCGQDVEIQGFKFLKDYIVSFPVYAVHHDPDIWPDPHTFNPERFTPENKAQRHPFAFLPFGQGPRNCIGMRLALLEMKIALAAILQVMTPVTCEKTVYPVRLQKFRMTAEDGLWVRLEERK